MQGNAEHQTRLSVRHHTLGSLETLSRLLRGRANRYAWFGLGLGLFAALAATLLHCRYETGQYSLNGMLMVQAANPALWALDVMPLTFLLWGQYIGMVISYQAGAMVMDETHALRERASLLARQLEEAPAPIGPRCHLPGRRPLLDAIDAALLRRQAGRERLMLWVVATDRYAALAHGGTVAEADGLVQQMSQRLGHALNDDVLLAHLGHDRFALFAPMRPDDPDGRRLAARLHLRFDTPVRLDTGPLDLRLQIGIAHSPPHGETADALLRHAEAACHLAQARGHDTEVFDPEHGSESAQEAHLLAELHGALLHEGLVDCYGVQHGRDRPLRLRQQPSWPHPLRGTLAAHHFMDLPARDTLLHELTVWQLRQAVQRLETLAGGHQPDLVIRPPARAWSRLPMADLVLRLLSAHDHPAASLTLELPVTLLLRETPGLQTTLSALAEAGVRLGTAGQGLLGAVPAAALVYPLHETRLPDTWLRNLGRDARAPAQLRISIEQLKALGLTVTLSGVDRAEQIQAAWEFGADYIEGRAVQPVMSPDRLADVILPT